MVIFDLDGTLVDSVSLIVDSFQYAFRTVLGHEWDQAEIRTWIGKSLYDSILQACPEHVDELYQCYSQWNHDHSESQIRAYDGVSELLQDLVRAGVSLGAATSKRVNPAQWALELSGLDDLVEILVAHDDVNEHKPDPEPLLLAAAKLGVPASDAVYVGDAVVDILSAHNAGMDCIAVTWGAGTPADLEACQPTVICQTVTELLNTLLPDLG